jgi:hypothetical protein
LGSANDPRPIRSHFFRRSAQGRNAGGVNAAALQNVHVRLAYQRAS